MLNLTPDGHAQWMLDGFGDIDDDSLQSDAASDDWSAEEIAHAEAIMAQFVESVDYRNAGKVD